MEALRVKSLKGIVLEGGDRERMELHEGCLHGLVLLDVQLTQVDLVALPLVELTYSIPTHFSLIRRKK